MVAGMMASKVQAVAFSSPSKKAPETKTGRAHAASLVHWDHSATRSSGDEKPDDLHGDDLHDGH